MMLAKGKAGGRPRAPSQVTQTAASRGATAGALLGAMLGLMGCAVGSEAPAQDPPGLSLWFAALADGTCTATTNGTKQVPEGVVNLVAQWTALVKEGDGLVQKSGTASSTRQLAAEGRWEIKNIPATDQLDLRIFGCSADKTLIYAGQTDRVQIQDGKKQTAHVYLAPVGDLGCTGSPVGASKLSSPRSLSGWAVLPGGDVIVAGGLGTWDKSQAKGKASAAIDYYDRRQGHFRPNWSANLGVARILPHVLPLGADETHVLVVGGALNAKRIGDPNLAMPLLGPELLGNAIPATKAELLQVGDQPSAASSPVDPGVGTALLSSAVSTGKSILFVGGQQQGGQVMDEATRLSDLEGVASGGPGITAGKIKLNMARLRPALLTFPGDDTVIVWGGMVPASGGPDNAKIGELVLDSNQSQALKIIGSAALLADPNLNTIAPAAAYVERATGVVTFLVTGGVEASSLSANKSLTYLVKVDKTAGTAELRAVSLPGNVALQGGIFGLATPLDDRRVLLGGGLMSVTEKVAGACDSAAPGDDCPLGIAWIVKIPGDLGTADAVLELGLLATQQLAVAKFGVVAAPLPLGMLLAGGQKSTTGGTDAEVLSDLGGVLTVTPADVDQSVICQ